MAASALGFLLVWARKEANTNSKPRRLIGKVSDKVVRGAVKRYSSKHGWGLIAHREDLTSHVGQDSGWASRDIRFYEADQKALGLVLGDLVEFSLAHDEEAPVGWLKAVDMTCFADDGGEECRRLKELAARPERPLGGTGDAGKKHGSPDSPVAGGPGDIGSAADADLDTGLDQHRHSVEGQGDDKAEGGMGAAQEVPLMTAAMHGDKDEMRKLVENASRDDLQRLLNARLARS